MTRTLLGLWLAFVALPLSAQETTSPDDAQTPEDTQLAGLFTPQAAVGAFGGFGIVLPDSWLGEEYGNQFLGGLHTGAYGSWFVPGLNGLQLGGVFSLGLWLLAEAGDASSMALTLGPRVAWRLQFLPWLDVEPAIAGGVMLGIVNAPRLAGIYDAAYFTSWVDAAVTVGFTFGYNHRLALGVRFTTLFVGNPVQMHVTPELSYTFTFGRRPTPPLTIELPDLPPVYPAQYPQYNELNRLKATVINPSDLDYDNVRVVAISPELDASVTGEPLALLSKGSSQDIELRVPLADSLLQRTERSVLNLELQVEYEVRGETFSKAVSAEVTVLPRNSLTWDDTRHLGSFLTYTNEGVMQFARNAVAAAKQPNRPVSNLTKILAVIHAMQSHGLVYNVDPNTPFDQVAGTSVIDTVQYPFELLTTKAGDCDDLVALAMSMLEALSVDTAALTVPGHIMFMADSGFSVDEAYYLGDWQDKAIAQDGKLWIPIEITLLEGQFHEMWLDAAEQVRQAREDQSLEIMPTRQKVTAFPPLSPEGADAPTLNVDEFDENYLSRRATLLTTMAEQAEAQLQRESDGSVTSRIRAVRVNLFYEQFDAARAEMAPILADDPNNLTALSLSAAIESLAGDPVAARLWAIRAITAAQQLDNATGRQVTAAMYDEIDQSEQPDLLPLQPTGPRLAVLPIDGDSVLNPALAWAVDGAVDQAAAEMGLEGWDILKGTSVEVLQATQPDRWLDDQQVTLLLSTQVTADQVIFTMSQRGETGDTALANFSSSLTPQVLSGDREAIASLARTALAVLATLVREQNLDL